MRFRLKRTLQVLAACACVVVYIDFFLVNKSAFRTLTFWESDLGPREVDREKFDSSLLRKSELTYLISEGNRSFSSNSTAPLLHQNNGSQTVAVNPPAVPSVYPSQEFYSDDRILSQLKFLPKSLLAGARSGSIRPRKILLHGGLGAWNVKRGGETFLEQKCSVPHCLLTDSREDLADADVVLFQGSVAAGAEVRPPHQKWLLYLLESPYHTPGLGGSNEGVPGSVIHG